MNRIVMILVLSVLAFACVPSDKGLPNPTGQADSPANAWKPLKNPAPATVASGSGQEFYKAWQQGEALRETIADFMAAGFMKDPLPVGFGDLAYSTVTLDLSLDSLGRIERIHGNLSELYEAYAFEIPVVQRMVDAVSGSRQVNWESIIVKLDEHSWQIQPVALGGLPPFILRIDGAIEITDGSSILRVSKNGSRFTCANHIRDSDGREELRMSWVVNQFELGPVRQLEVPAATSPEVPVILAWEPGLIAGYLVGYPDGQAEFTLRLRWLPSGDLATDLHNFLVLLTQRHGSALAVRDRIGAVDPIWLALLMYDNVVLP